MQRSKLFSSVVINATLFIIVLFWTIPTIGLFVSSFRQREDIKTSGWWTVLPHYGYVNTGETLPLPEGGTRDMPIEINGVSKLFEEWQDGVVMPNGDRYVWVGNLRRGQIEIQQGQWQMNTDFTLDNYGQILAGREYEIRDTEGNVTTVQGDDFVGAFLNSLTVSIPATIIPILIAAFAAYGFAWMKFPGRRFLFILVVAMLVVPLQISLIPVLYDYSQLQLTGTYLGIWLAHTGFGLPLATYLLYNYISGLPKDLLESAFIDGASHFTIFFRLVLPLSVPALASFAIFQFLWVWNDYLVALIFIGSGQGAKEVLTIRIADMVGTRGQDWHLLTAAGFVSMIVPLLVFFGLQRYFVRGLMAGSVKG
jgi:alpha-glucoside transport system permease protein